MVILLLVRTSPEAIIPSPILPRKQLDWGPRSLPGSQARESRNETPRPKPQHLSLSFDLFWDPHCSGGLTRQTSVTDRCHLTQGMSLETKVRTKPSVRPPWCVDLALRTPGHNENLPWALLLGEQPCPSHCVRWLPNQSNVLRIDPTPPDQ